MNDNQLINSKEYLNSAKVYHRKTILRFVDYAIKLLESENLQNTRYKEYLEMIELNPIKEEINKINSKSIMEEDFHTTIKEKFNSEKKESDCSENSTSIKKKSNRNVCKNSKIRKDSQNCMVKTKEDSKHLITADDSPKIVSVKKKRFTSILDRDEIPEQVRGMKSLQNKQIYQLSHDLRKAVLRESKIPQKHRVSCHLYNSIIPPNRNNYTDKFLQLSIKEKIKLFNSLAKEQNSSPLNGKMNNRNNFSNKFNSNHFKRSSSYSENRDQFKAKHLEESLKFLNGNGSRCKNCNTFPRTKITQRQENLVHHLSSSRTLPTTRKFKLERGGDELLVDPHNIHKEEESLYEIEFLEVAEHYNKGLIPLKMRIKRCDFGNDSARAHQIHKEKLEIPLVTTSVKALIAGFERRRKM